MGKYVCWNCGLWYGDESEPEESSHLCPVCEAAKRPEQPEPLPYDKEA